MRSDRDSLPGGWAARRRRQAARSDRPGRGWRPAGAATRAALFLIAGLSGACATTRAVQTGQTEQAEDTRHPNDLAIGDPGRRDNVLTVPAGALLDTRRGDRVSADEMAARLDDVRLVFVGETHANPAAQETELRVLEALARRGRKVLVGLEMLPASVQPALDRWVAGDGSEDDLLRGIHWYKHWGFHFGYYRPIFQFARDNKAPMVGVNVEREVITNVRKIGLDKLAPEDRAKLPPRLDLDNAEHRALFTAYMGGAHEMPPDMLEGMFRAQCAWDGVMGWNAVRALQAEPDPRAVMVVLIGVGHVAYGLGAQRQADLWGNFKAASVASVAEADEDGAARTVRGSFADFIWGAPAPDKAPVYPTLGASLTDKPGATGPAISGIRPGSPAAKAGLAAGDMVTAIDGVATPDKEATLFEMARKGWGDTVAVEVVRKEGKKTLSALLERAPAPAVTPAPTSPAPAPGEAKPPDTAPPTGAKPPTAPHGK